MKKRTIEKSWNSLMKKGVKVVNNILQIKEGSLGIKCWGNVDFLIWKGYAHGYTIIP